MSIKYLDTPDGFFVNLDGRLGCIQATIHRPDKGDGRKTWILCFATCTGEAHSLIGKVLKHNTLAAVKHDLERYDIVRDLHEVIISMCARLYGKRSAKNRAQKALDAIHEAPHE
jgi:hypothetical protein